MKNRNYSGEGWQGYSTRAMTAEKRIAQLETELAMKRAKKALLQAGLTQDEPSALVSIALRTSETRNDALITPIFSCSSRAVALLGYLLNDLLVELLQLHEFVIYRPKKDLLNPCLLEPEQFLNALGSCPNKQSFS